MHPERPSYRRPPPHRARIALLALGILGAPLACSGEADAPSDGAPVTSNDPSAPVLPSDATGTPVGAPPPGASSDPSDPVNPTATGNPLDPNPAGTTDPLAPANPLDPTTPVAPTDPMSPTGPDTPAPSTCADDAVSVSESVLRRLTRLEYQLTLKELLRLDALPDVSLIPEDPKYKGFRTVAALQTSTTQHLRGFADEAQALASALLADPTRQAEVIGCSLDAEGCLDEFTARFGRLAFRRALGADEVTSLATRANEYAESPSDAFAFVIEAVLTSPSFLFRIEVGDGSAGLATLTSTELASKLSFSILGRGPDDALLTRGESGELATAEGLAAAATELVSDPRAQEYFDAFFRQWLDFEELRAPPVPPAGYSDALLDQMVEETELLLADHVWTGVDFLGALTASYTHVRPELATFYGLTATGPEATRVEFTPDHPRYGTGLLTHPALIAAKSDGDLIAHRGKWFFSTFLCQDLEVPQGLLDSLGTELEGLTRTEMLEKRNEDTRCNSCHRVIDPIGIGFAQYDSNGLFDPSVLLADFPLAPALAGSEPPEFGSVAELANLLTARPEVPGCLSQRVFLYTQGREPAAADACGMERVTATFNETGRDFQQLLLALVTAPEFRLRQPATSATP